MIVPIIVLTPEQEAVLAAGAERVMIQRPDGRVAAVVDPRRNKPLFTSEEVAEAERRADSPGPWYTTAEVLAHLHSLGQP